MNHDRAIAVQVERARAVIRRQHKAIATEQAYCGWLWRYFRFIYSLPKEMPSERKAEAFLNTLAQRDVSASTQNGAFHAIRFFYQDVLLKPRARVRYHVLPSAVQQAVKESRRRLGISVVPHELRHSYATHLLDRGTNLKALSKAMGHVQIETTAGYCHAEALSVGSPLDALG